MYGCGKDCLILIPFRLPQIGCFTLSFECFSSDSDNCPDVGIDRTTASVPPPTKGRPHPTKTLVFPPSSFILPSFAWFYILSSTSQVLLFALSWYSACTSVSKGVFLMWEDGAVASRLDTRMLLPGSAPASPLVTQSCRGQCEWLSV